MTRTILLFLILLGAVGCRDATFVIIQRLAPGGGTAADGGTYTYDQPSLTISVRMENDATNFRAFDLMRLHVNGVDRTDEMVIGGLYALLTIDPAPVGVPQSVELFTRTGTVPADLGTWVAMPYTGPTLLSVAPNEARVGTQVTITGTGFAAGPVRLFFGGLEATVDSSDDTSIAATVPADAEPGLVYVLVGDDAAFGVVGFQPLDLNDTPVPFPTLPKLYAAFPANGVVETPLVVYGLNYSDLALPSHNRVFWFRVLNVQTVDVDPIGEIVMANAVVGLFNEAEPGDLRLTQSSTDTNTLPFVITE